MSGSSAAHRLSQMAEELVECRRCPRLVAWREEVAEKKRRAYRNETYWGRPVPGFGDADASLVIVGLAPAAHGANRTGRMFTGDRSGDFLYAALFRAGLASQPTSTHRDDGLVLRGVFITAPCRCAPPENKPAPGELAACRSWLEQELQMLHRARVYFALGKTGYDAVTGLARDQRVRADESPGQRRLDAPPRIQVSPFSHGIEVHIPDPRGFPTTTPVFASYHVSQQNTQTGRLTTAMFDEVLSRAAHAAGLTAG